MLFFERQKWKENLMLASLHMTNTISLHPEPLCLETYALSLFAPCSRLFTQITACCLHPGAWSVLCSFAAMIWGEPASSNAFQVGTMIFIGTPRSLTWALSSPQVCQIPSTLGIFLSAFPLQKAYLQKNDGVCFLPATQQCNHFWMKAYIMSLFTTFYQAVGIVLIPSLSFWMPTICFTIELPRGQGLNVLSRLVIIARQASYLQGSEEVLRSRMKKADIQNQGINNPRSDLAAW